MALPIFLRLKQKSNSLSSQLLGFWKLPSWRIVLSASNLLIFLLLQKSFVKNLDKLLSFVFSKSSDFLVTVTYFPCVTAITLCLFRTYINKLSKKFCCRIIRIYVYISSEWSQNLKGFTKYFFPPIFDDWLEDNNRKGAENIYIILPISRFWAQ